MKKRFCLITALQHIPIHGTINIISTPKINRAINDATRMTKACRQRRVVDEFHVVLPLFTVDTEEIE